MGLTQTVGGALPSCTGPQPEAPSCLVVSSPDPGSRVPCPGQAKVPLSSPAQPSEAEVLESPTSTLLPPPLPAGHPRVPDAPHWAPAGTATLREAWPPVARELSPLPCQRPSTGHRPTLQALLTTATLSLLGNMCLTFVSSISNLSHPHSLSCSGPSCGLFLGGEGEAFREETHLPLCCLALGQQAEVIPGELGRHCKELPDQHGLKHGNRSQRNTVKSLALETVHGGWVWVEASEA